MHICREEAAAKELGEYRMIVVMDNNVHLMSIVVADDENSSAKSLGKLTCLNNEEEQVKVYQVFHCESLLLCILKDDPRVVVWNPYCGQTKWIETRYCCSIYNGLKMYNYALGYVDKKNESLRSYKILRLLDYLDRYPVPGDDLIWYEIYDFDSGLWRTLDVTPHWFIESTSLGVSFKGKTYWQASDRISHDDNYIICFDFTSESFGPLLPLPFSAVHEIVTLSCVGEEKLAVLFQQAAANDIKIWITTEVEAEKVSWSKVLTLDLSQFDFVRVNIPQCFYIDVEKKVAIFKRSFSFDQFRKYHTVSIIGEDRYFRELDLGERAAYLHGYPQVCSYVPSLVQIIKQPEGAKGNQESSLEKHLYDQKMLGVVELDKLITTWMSE